MEVPQHWVRVEGWSEHLGRAGGTVAVWGWSTQSDEDAEQVGRARLAETLERIRVEGRLPATRGYYPRTPLREPVLEEVLADDGRRLGLVTRNRMGCEVLCTDALFIADVDVPGLDVSVGDGPPSGGGPRAGGIARFLRRLVLGAPDPAPQAPSGEDAAGLDLPRGASRPGHEMFSAGVSSRGPAPSGGEPSVAELLACEPVWAFAQRHPSLGVRIYRTLAGLRVVVTGAAAGPMDDRSRRLLTELGSDPLYVELCATHDSYRARLTPKPFRVGVASLPVSWPCADDAAERAWLRWVDDYEDASRGFATCRLLSASGPVPSSDEQRLLELHDERCRVDVRGPLA